jgi:hypothetical protein
MMEHGAWINSLTNYWPDSQGSGVYYIKPQWRFHGVLIIVEFYTKKDPQHYPADFGCAKDLSRRENSTFRHAYAWNIGQLDSGKPTTRAER